jgi:hypothetical protein
MKNVAIKLFLSAVLLLFIQLQTNTINAQERTSDRVMASPNASVSQTIGLTVVEVTYGRPSVRGRVIFGDLVPFGEVWRTGANESTAVTFSDDVTVNGKELSAGTYSLYTIPGSNEWTMIFNNKLSWGTQYDEREDVVRIEVVPEETHPMEQMLIYFENVTAESGDMFIHWDDVRVPVTIEPIEE